MQGVSILIPSIGREKRLERLLDTVHQDIDPYNIQVVIVLDREHIFSGNLSAYRDHLVITTDMIGYWRCLNLAIDMAKHPHILWTADDILPVRNWVSIAMDAFDKYYPDGLGIVGLNDGFVMDATCGHALTTKQFIEVLFGEERFPQQFEHLYLDTLVVNRAKELGCYYFCEEAYVGHQHFLIGNVEQDETSRINEERALIGIGDKARKDEMDDDWITGGLQRAIDRLGRAREERNE